MSLAGTASWIFKEAAVKSKQASNQCQIFKTTEVPWYYCKDQSGRILTLAFWCLLQVLTVLCNIAAKGSACCQALHQKAVLFPLISILALPDDQVVAQDLELLHLLFHHWPEVFGYLLFLYFLKAQESWASSELTLVFSFLPQAAADFVGQSGLQALEQHQDKLQLQEQVKVLIWTAKELTALPQNSPLHASAENLQSTSLQSWQWYIQSSHVGLLLTSLWTEHFLVFLKSGKSKYPWHF